MVKFSEKTSRWLVVAAVTCLSTHLAIADCGDEAHAARARVTGLGPMHFETVRWNDQTSRRLCGQLEPGRAHYDRECGEGDRAGREDIRIDDQSWHNDGLGWQGPYGSIWTHQGAVPENLPPSQQIVQTSCPGQVNIDGRDLNKYEFVVRTIRGHRIETLFTDAASGVPVRYDRSPEGSAGLSNRTIYRYDSSIRLEPPGVDLEKRRATSMQRFFEAVALSDPACRRETVAVIQRSGTVPFHYEMKGAFPVGVSGVNGIFAPPRSILQRIEGAPYHGGGTEVIAIGDDVWIKRQSDGWKWDGNERNWVHRLFEELVPATDHIGRVSCLGRMVIEGANYSAYEYDYYADTNSARERVDARRVLVNPVTGLPVRIEQTTGFGLKIETRRYDETLKIEQPVEKIAPLPLPPAVPFDEFRRRLFLK